MKKNTVFQLLLFITVSLSYAQEPTFTWAKANFGGNNDKVTGVAIDTQGSVIEAGFFASGTNPNTGLGAFNLQGNIIQQSPNSSFCSSCYSGDAYLAKYNVNGELLWHIQATGGLAQEISSITTDSSDNIFICGTYFAENFSLGNYTSSVVEYAGYPFIAKVSPEGLVLWVRRIDYQVGSYPAIAGRGVQVDSIKVDSNGNVYVGGVMQVASISSGVHSLDLLVVNNEYKSDSFIVKYDTNGNTIWLKGIQSAGYDNISKLHINNQGEIFFSGYSIDPQIQISGVNFDIPNTTLSYLFKMNTNGTPTLIDFGFYYTEISSDSSGNIYGISSRYYQGLPTQETITFGTSTVTFQTDNINKYFLTVSKYSSSGQRLWMKSSLSNYYITGKGIEVRNDRIFILGQYIMPTSFGGFNLPNIDYISVSGSASSPEYKTFISELNTNGAILWAKQAGTSYKLVANDFEVDNAGAIVIGGEFLHGNPIDYGGFTLSGYPGSSFKDSFIVKYNTLISGTTARFTHLSKPIGMTIDNTNKLYITETGLSVHKVSRADLSQTVPQLSPLFSSNLNGPSRLRVSPDNKLYVSERQSNEISRADLNLTSPILETFISSSINAPVGLDIFGNNLLIGDFGSSTIKNFTLTNSPIQSTTLVNSFASDIVNNSERFYFVNEVDPYVYSSLALSTGDNSVSILTDIAQKPAALAIYNNKMFVADKQGGKIHMVDLSTNPITSQVLLSGLNSPNSLSIYDNKLFIVETAANRIVSFNLTGLLNQDEFDNQDHNILVYPNPATDLIYFDSILEVEQIQISDVNGRLIMQNNFVKDNSISIATIPTGVYILKMFTTDGIFTKKIIKL